MGMKNKTVSVTTAVFFSIVLAALMILTFLASKEEYSFFENRNLAAFPVIRMDTMVDGSAFDAMDNYLSDHAALRSDMMQIRTWAEIHLFQKPVVNEVVLGDDCLLSYLGWGEFSRETMKQQAAQMAQNLAAHRDAAEAFGGHFCFVAVPCQFASLADRYPWYLDNRSAYTKDSLQALFAELDRYGVAYIDMGERIRNLSEEERKQFTSRSDNHYSIRGAWYVYGAMTDMIAAKWNGSPDVLDEDDFDLIDLPNEYLGSYRRKLFALIPDDERLPILIPKTEIPFTRTQRGEEVSSSVYAFPAAGDYATYTVYMGGDMPQTTIETHRSELPDLLIYGDSFTNAVECVAYTGFNRMDSLDFRYYKDCSLDDYIAEMKPDYVFCIRDYESILDCTNNGQ